MPAAAPRKTRRGQRSTLGSSRRLPVTEGHVLRALSTLLALAAAAAVSFAAATAARSADTVHLTIVHTNDLHSYTARFPAIAAVAREAKAKNPNTLFLDAGDCITGTPVSTVFQGEPMFEILTVMGYDAGTIGNHEFDHGWRKIEKFRALAGFPLLNANAFDEDGRSFGDEPYHVFTTGGVRIGVIGLLTDDMSTLTTKDNWGRCKVRSPLKTAKDLVPEVRKQCDVLVLLTHVGVEGDVAIAGAVPGIDLIVGGHSHTELKEPIWVACGEKKVPVVQAYRYGERVGIVDFDWDPSAKSVRDLHGRLVAIDPAKMPNATDVKQICDLWVKKAAEQVDLTEVIGRSTEKLTKAKLRVGLERIYAEVLKADFGYQNLHGVRADIPAGDIRVEDIWRVLPFENTLVTFRLKGDQVPAYAKRQLGAGFDASREYVFATNSYAADQMRKYFGVSGVPVEKPGLAMRQTVVDWVRAHKGFGDPASAPAHDDDEGDGK